jgi:endoglucanase
VAWAVTNWTVTLHATSSGEAHSQTVPSAPTGVTAICNAPTSARTIKVSWTAVTHATTYTVYDSTTSATGTYSAIATGVATTSWTSGSLSAGTNYWFEVTVSVGSNWTSAKSSASPESTINTFSPYCVQP